MQYLFRLIEKLAEDDLSTVLIHGESGTGKELVAKAIHAHSERKKHNFVPVNCAAIPDDLLESELFGHTKGSFTGATSSKVGRIEYAEGGTLFLDEIGDMKPVLQAKLLRVLQEREFEPVGALKPIPVDVRVIAATHRNLEDLVSQGQFREDLYYRLSVVPVIIPPLLSQDALRTLAGCPWRGNVRELENLVQHMSILHGGKIVTREDLPPKYCETEATSQDPALPQQPGQQTIEPEQLHLFSNTHQGQEEDWPDEGIDFNAIVNDFETQLIVQALKMSDGNKKEAARILNLKRTTLLEKIKKKNIQDAWQSS